jgi:cysteinyl-tRNA synthetase
VIRVHDTLAREKVELVPRDPGKLSIYVCGPTVYEVPHVGHGRAAVVFDVIRRYLEWAGVEVMFVSNVTDVEDKIIARAAEEGTSESEVAQRYEAAYWDAMDRLGVRRPDHLPRATEYIDPMLKLIDDLVKEGRAYVVEGQGVYFDVESYESYGDLSHRQLADLLETAGSRVEVDERKRSRPRRASRRGTRPGARAGPAGTSSARRCRSSCSARASICTGEATTSSSPITRTSAPRRRAPATRLPVTGSTTGW